MRKSTLSFLPFLFCLSIAFPASGADTGRPALIPQPRELTVRANVSLKNGVSIVVPGRNAEDQFAAHDLSAALKEDGVRARDGGAGLRVYLLRDDSAQAKRVLRQERLTFDPAMQPEGYVLVTGSREAYIIGHTAGGVFYGAQTLKQLVTAGGEGEMLQGAAIRDWPAMKWRGVHDDLSRGPLPTLDFQKKQIRTFAAYKLNMYSPYFENTLQYNSNPLPSLPGGSMSQADAKALVEYAKQYHVTVVPEQEAFGHLHKVLIWQKYAPLAEIPNGAVLAPGQPGSIPLIAQWFDELAGIFPGPYLHIGADETFELGQGQTQAAVQQQGLGAVYIDFLTRIHQALAPLHRQLLFWGDMAMNSPDLVPRLPHDMIAVPWHYDPEPQGFAKWLDPYTHAGMQTWVAPGVNNWSRVWPDFNMALGNIQGFVADGQKAGSTGMLNTIWNDDGEGLFLQDWYAVLFGADAAWHPGTTNPAQFEQSYGRLFHNDTTGDIDQAQQALMAAQQVLAGAGLEDARDAWFWVDPWSPEGQQVAAKLMPVAAQVRLDAEQALTMLVRARIAAAQLPAAGALRETDALEAVDLGARRMDFLVLKFQLADQIADAYRRLYDGQKNPEVGGHASRDLWNLAGVNGLCEDMRDGYHYLRTEYSDVWLMENRPYWLNNVTDRYDAAARMWVERGNKLAAAREQWHEHHTLPTPEEIGIPPVSSSATGAAGVQ